MFCTDVIRVFQFLPPINMIIVDVTRPKRNKHQMMRWFSPEVVFTLTDKGNFHTLRLTENLFLS